MRICITALHLAVGVCFLIRGPLVKNGTVRGIAASVPSLLICGIAFAIAPSANTWPLAAQYVFACGTLFAVVSVFTLGRSFAVLPALREIVATGPYRVVRHPIYFGEMLMVVGCFVAKPTGLTVLPLLAALPCLITRVLAEESLLRESDRYRDYAIQVRWRLIPGIW
ncbi:MAG: isoprenylcysteine carboxylmethyltransferase family protein [Planctomycetaceae bacterium]|nr:isoprenylcysteine carboxylmethyltransferase family protein [Planctomycetaceae bacterium]